MGCGCNRHSEGWVAVERVLVCPELNLIQLYPVSFSPGADQDRERLAKWWRNRVFV